MKPSQLRAFASRVHSNLLNPNIQLRKVVANRISDQRLIKCQQRRQTTLATSSTELLQSDIPHSEIKATEFVSIPTQSNKSALSTPSAESAQLPTSCPGCGALAQEVNTQEPGYYSRTRKGVRAYLRWQRDSQDNIHNGDIEADVGSEEVTDGHALSSTTTSAHPTTATVVQTPVCDRCHELIHYFRGKPVSHPSIEDIADSIEESPFDKNHVYHVLDAADFPASLVPSIGSKLDLARPRSQNRRSRPFSSKPTLSFIITRSDLLGPTKEHVDSLLPYLRDVLRTALGKHGEKLRLGHVHLVSAKRGWWTKDIKDDIWYRGGGNWMVGKFNVGKSNLFEVLFPKASNERVPSRSDWTKQPPSSQNEIFLSETSLLPPPQPEMPFPVLPLVSSLPGTTASPIRIPFGNSKGELIDLPGLERGGLEKYVQDDHKLDLVMTTRPKVAQYNIKPGQSLLLGGGVVRITPQLEEGSDMVVSAFPFVPLEAHVTSTDKAIGSQEQTRESGITSILAEGVGGVMKSAGVFSLDTDVTKRHAAPLLRAGVDSSRLPFQVFSTDILVEGVGWVELACQVRKRRREAAPDSPAANPKSDSYGVAQLIALSSNNNPADFKPFTPALNAQPQQQNQNFHPRVEVFTPEGKNISQRVPMGAWMLWKDNLGNQKKQTRTAVRPRHFVSGARRRLKLVQ